MTTSLLRSKAWVLTGLVAAGWTFGAQLNPVLFRSRYFPTMPTDGVHQ